MLKQFWEGKILPVFSTTNLSIGFLLALIISEGVRRGNNIVIQRNALPKDESVDKCLLKLESLGFIVISGKDITVFNYFRYEHIVEDTELYRSDELIDISMKYKNFMQVSKRSNTFKAIEDKLYSIAVAKKKTANDIAVFFNIVKGMVYEEISIHPRASFKEQGIAKTLLNKYKSTEILDLILFFITNFDLFKNKSIKEPSIFSFSFVLTDVRAKLGNNIKDDSNFA